MKFNSVEINERTFRKKMFGLDPDQIFDFLRKLSVEMDMLTKDKADLKKQLQMQPKCLIEFEMILKEKQSLLSTMPIRKLK
jgi:cell division septum initiation protein DivIVA